MNQYYYYLAVISTILSSFYSPSILVNGSLADMFESGYYWKDQDDYKRKHFKTFKIVSL